MLFKNKLKDNRAGDNNSPSPEFQKFLSGLDAETIRIWEESKHCDVFDEIDISADWDNVRTRIGDKHLAQHRYPEILKWVLRVAAVILVAVGLTWALKKKDVPAVRPSGMITSDAAGSVRELRLPDGSVVNLNVGSELTYSDDFNKGSRDVILRGEGLFDVMPGNSMPFRVLTGESIIQVTGTTFTVYQKDKMVEVAVLEGKVILSSVVNKDNSVVISQNQSGYINNEEVTLRDGVDANNLSWKTGLLIFDETPLDSALIDIAHHFRKDLRMETTIDDDITAEFENQTLGEILGELEQVSPLVFDTTGGVLTVSR